MAACCLAWTAAWQPPISLALPSVHRPEGDQAITRHVFMLAPEDDEYLVELERDLQRAARGLRGFEPRTFEAAPKGRPPLRRAWTAADVPKIVLRLYSDYLDRPGQELLLGSFSLLFGFYIAEGITPGFVGQGGYWEYAAGAVATTVYELDHAPLLEPARLADIAPAERV
eukprot:CAMPEP_0183333808 /NCGR_PEP_ID=MMETSP0164_2-20130417/2596_1 /TAXON_ID=221442 /ORGANISM="Coccolithus pelagicus ssp braarudi, Strain PLY182g" /LENGTH=169 /DNA_ID=CAMNT_0025502813 /DNA_START=20 /DNA_END=528 /DNA_ORIENTATION=-